jgi:squalene-hopene/tetraprenyl-beta-curcumene cyclase
MSPRQLQASDALHAAAVEARRRSAEALVGMHRADGYWWADLTADTTLESDYILLQLWLFPPEGGVWNPPTRELVNKAVNAILRRQLPDGGFNIYPDGPPDVSATVKAYFALKLAGVPVDDPRMVRAREVILGLGGIQAANSYVKLNLSFFDLYPRDCCPSVPPEMMLLPHDFIYQMSSWTRAIVIPLSILHGMEARRPVPEGFDLKELWLEGGSRWAWLKDRKVFTWRNVFLALDRLAKYYEKHRPGGFRRRAILRAEQWMLERTKYSDGLGAIYPAMMYVIMALDELGYAPEHPDRVEAQRQFDNLMIERENEIQFQPCFSPVWDTAIAAFALGESGHGPVELMRQTGDWLLTKEVRRKGDWSVKRPNTEPSGWYFEFANEFYPDIDDTAMVLLGLQHTKANNQAALDACIKRAVRWLLGMQSKDGGWAAFDVDNNWEPLSYVPFADHNAMLDPTCPDITGRVLEALCRYGVSPNHQAVKRAVDYLLRTQEQDGSWYGRWGVGYIYGTFLALRGLRAAGVSDREASILRAGEWLRSIQNADGGWGESCASYETHCCATAASTPSQTAWAVLGLIAGGDDSSLSVQKGIEYLIETQRPDGTWDEHLATGTGFPRVFYLSYHLYRNTFPLLALSSYLKAKREVA